MTKHCQRTYTHFLERSDLYKTEKPYELRFVPNGDFPRENLVKKRHDDIEVEDVRGWEEQLKIGRNGFELMPLDAPMLPHEYDDKEAVERRYLPLVAKQLTNLLGASRIQIHDYLVHPPCCQSVSGRLTR